MIRYHNVIDIEGNIITIDYVTQENRKATQLFCIGCGREMIPALGEVNEHHFRHKEIGDCNPETYLHHLAKRNLKNRFDTQAEFPVKFYVQNECQKADECEFKQRYKWKVCASIVLKTVNMKEFYDTCEEEVSYQGFKADLMFSHSKYPEREPFFLEIAVTHNCDDKKIDSGIRIIEIKVEREKDAFRELIENDGELVPKSKSYSYSQPPIRFYNFKRKNLPSHSLSRFYLFRDAKGICRAEIKPDAATCHNADFTHNPNAVFEITVSEAKIAKKKYGLYPLGIALAYKYGFGIRSCILCSRYSTCRMRIHSSYIKPAKLTAQQLERMSLPYHCNKYKVYEYVDRRIISSFKYIPYWERIGG